MKIELTKRGDYAIRAMLALAGRQDEPPLSARRIAAEMAIPRRFLPQVMADLTRAGLVTAKTGRTGGYRLARPAHDVTLLAIVEAVEGDTRRRSCVVTGEECGGDTPCAVHDAFIAAQEGMRAAFAAMTLAEAEERHADGLHADRR